MSDTRVKISLSSLYLSTLLYGILYLQPSNCCQRQKMSVQE